MIFGIPKEIKNNEERVAVTPAGVAAFVSAGHEVVIQENAGLGSGITDEQYIAAGAQTVTKPRDVFDAADMIMKVKEPLPPEYDLLRGGQVLFTFLHLAPEPELTQVLLRKRVVAIAYETIQPEDGSLPLLTPMSEVAGRMSIQVGAQILETMYGGKGLLLSGVPGVSPARVTIIGGGVVGTNAAKIAIGMGAEVTILDTNLNRLRYLNDIFGARLKTLMSNSYNVRDAVSGADLVIGAVLIPGAKAPRVVTEEMVRNMSPGSAIVDVAVDQGGCVETVDRVTTHDKPTYLKHGVVHYSVANMPGAVARTSTFALTNTTFPYALALANKGYEPAIREDLALARGVNVVDGKVTHQAVAEALELEYTPLHSIMDVPRALLQ